jgi:hypothetical protein
MRIATISDAIAVPTSGRTGRPASIAIRRRALAVGRPEYERANGADPTSGVPAGGEFSGL